MAKKNISKIITSGTLKQRINLLAEDVARNRYGESRLLTDSEFSRLTDSFRKEREVNAYNRTNRLDKVISNSIMNLQGLKFQVLMNYSNLRGYILLWNSIETAELLVNSILHEIPDTDKRIEIAELGGLGINMLFSKTVVDKEGYLDLKIDHATNGEDSKAKEKYDLIKVMNNVRKETEESIIKFKSWAKAIEDLMDEEGFNVKTYKDFLKAMREDVYTPIIGWQKYHTDSPEFALSNNRLNNLKEHYNITPDLQELEVDEVIYEHFRNEILG